MTKNELVTELKDRLQDIPIWLIQCYLLDLMKRNVGDEVECFNWIDGDAFFRISNMLEKMNVLRIEYTYNSIKYNTVREILRDNFDAQLNNDLFENTYISYFLRKNF